MFFRKKVDTSEVLKWGVLSGFFQGLFLILLSLLMLNKRSIFPIAEGWEFFVTVLGLFLFGICLLISVFLVFGHPTYSFMQKRYREGWLTLLTTLVTLGVVFLVILFINVYFLNTNA